MQKCEGNQIVNSETLKWERDRVVTGEIRLVF